VYIVQISIVLHSVNIRIIPIDPANYLSDGTSWKKA
jgi:hypothetical protein